MDDLQKHINEEVRETLKIHTDSLKISNHEMGAIKEHLAIIETDIGWFKEKFQIFEDSIKGLNAKLWGLIITLVVGMIGIITALIKLL